MKNVYFLLILFFAASHAFSQGKDKNNFSENFEGSFPPAGWTKYMPDGGTGWRLDTAGTYLDGWSGTSLITAPSGGDSHIACVTYLNGGTDYNDTWLITPRLSISAGDYLIFWATNFTDYEDSLDILISTSTNSSSDFTHLALTTEPTTNGVWTKYLVNLSAYAGQQIYIAFNEYVSDNISFGGYIGLDMVSIGAPPTIDAGIEKVTAPEKGCNLSSSEQVTISIKNYGISPISNVPVHYSMNNQVTVNDQYNGSIAPGATVEFTFATPVNATVEGFDSIVAWTSLPGDQDTANDHSPLYYFGNTLPSSIPYSFNAEWNGPDWEEAFYWAFEDLSGNGFWDYGDAQYAHTGTGFWVYYGSDVDAANDWLISKCIHLDVGINYSISFWIKNSDLGGKTNKLKLTYGTSQNPADLTNTIIDLPDINDANASTYVQKTSFFSVAASGSYYFGWHVYSNANNDNIYLDDIHIEISGGVEDLNQTGIRIFPNPVRDIVRIESISQINEISVFNTLGEEIIHANPGAAFFEINSSMLSKGTYLIKMITATGYKTSKIFVD